LSRKKLLFKKVIKKYYQDDDARLNDVEITQFKDQEISIHYNESIRQDKVFIIQTTSLGSDNIMELFLMLDSAKRASAEKKTYNCRYMRMINYSETNC
jgi:phosphoribosylpyrophosphate synthetase